MMNFRQTLLVAFLLAPMILLHAEQQQISRPDIVIADFEQGYGDWIVKGEAFNHPTTAVSGAKGFVGKCIANSYDEGSSVLAGTLTSPQFTIERNFIRFLVCGRGFNARGIEDNMLSVPTDDPMRDERMGWTGDGQLNAPAAVCFMDMHGFYRKWVTDIRDGQLKDGAFPNAAPLGNGASFGPGWSDAGVTMPWLLYVVYGDRRVLEEQFAAARRWVDFVQAANPDGIYRNKRGGDWGDWLNGSTLLIPGWRAEGCSVPNELSATAIWARSTEIVAKIAGALGDSQAAAEYRQRHHRIKTAFQQAFLKPDGTLTGDAQAGYALALHYGLIDDPMRHKVAGRLAEAVRSRGGHPTTGLVSTRPLFEALSENGLHDDACRMILLREAPSLGYMIENGATTIWERWDGYIKGRGYGHPRMNALNIPTLGSAAAWVWRYLAGIAVDEASPGYKHFFIQPSPCDGVDWVRASYNSVRGPITVEWKKVSGRLNLKVSVPPNTTATVKLPDGTTKSLESGQYTLSIPEQKKR